MTDDSGFQPVSVTICPDCDEIIGTDQACRCSICGRSFHMECLDPDTFACLDCEIEATRLDKAPGCPPDTPHNE